MARFIQLHPGVVRCRPQDGLSKLSQECGHQKYCARWQAANTSGGKVRDFSRGALTMGKYVGCQWYVALDGCEQHRDPVDIKTWGKHD